MTSAAIATRVLPRSWVTSVVSVVGAAALTALAAQWRLDLPFTPVPITGQCAPVFADGAIVAGVVPFLVGDLIKAAAAGVLLPGAWRLVGEAALPEQEVSSRWT